MSSSTPTGRADEHAPRESERPLSSAPEEEEGPDEETASSALMKAMRDVAPYLDLGWRLAGSAAFPPLIGIAVDVWLGTLPWGLLVGSVLGLSAAVLQLTRLQDDFK